MEKFYITTPIYYPSGKFHIGTAYTTVLADTVKRYKQLRGYDVFMLTGTDEHGQKIETVAKEHGKTPKEYVDGMAELAKELWKLMDIKYNYFIIFSASTLSRLPYLIILFMTCLCLSIAKFLF